MAKVSLEELMEKTGNIYEAVAIMAKRSRQVNDIQKKLIDQERDTMPIVDIRDSEDFEDVEIDREALNREYTKLPKPTTVSIFEMRDGKIEYRYKEEEA
ncbi:DNA-directed RNA polymerase subunit omega [bacterium]|nr:DNA-directed RNA polymerase subunit omega [bacterium]